MNLQELAREVEQFADGQLYKVRCSPDCPFEDCVILTNVPPQSQQGGPGDNNSDTDSNSADSDSDSGDNQAAENQAQSGDNGEGAMGNGGGHLQEPPQHGGDAGRQRPGQPPSDSGNSPGSADQKGGQQPQPPAASSPAPEKSDQPAEPDQGKGGQSGTPEAQTEQAKEDQADGQAEPTPQAAAPDPYKEVFPDGQPLPENFSQGGGAGRGKTGLVNLGNHDKRLLVVHDPTFHQQLRNVLIDNAYDRRVRGRKRGQLDMKSLYKVPMKVENIFTLKEARKNRHYNVTLLVDQSGSMFNRRADYDTGKIIEGNIDVAADCASFLARALDKVDINYSVIGYDSRYKHFKKFNETATDDKLNKIKYDLTHTGGGGTELARPLEAAYKDIKQMPRDYQNIIICLSDGEPDDREEVRRLVKHHAQDVDFIDIGIGNRPLMKSGFRIDELAELKPLLIKQLRQRIRRG